MNPDFPLYFSAFPLCTPRLRGEADLFQRILG